jgi:hypothetical protein
MRKLWIDDPDYLRRWFLAKGHPFVVFRIVDVLELLPSDQRDFIRLVQRAAPEQIRAAEPEADGDLRRMLQAHVGRLGYVRLPVGAITKSIEELRQLQSFVYAYRSRREAKMEPMRVSDCDCRGKDANCMYCGGKGVINTMLEMSDVEVQLAEGKPWDQVQGL